VRFVQLRSKRMPAGEMLELAGLVVARCRAAGALLIVNDRADVARMAQAHGLHVGQEDLSPADARLVIGEDALLGLSTHDVAQVDAACQEPISYLAIGPVFATATKTAAQPVVGIAGVEQASRRARAAGLPTVAIGGITLDQAPRVVGAGAAAVAVISDLLVDDAARRARAYVAALA
jgi:thiamine-phosphate pyrophosphorylase